MGLVSVFLTLRSLMHHFPHWAGKKGLDIVGLSVHEDKGPGLLGKWLIPGGGAGNTQVSGESLMVPEMKESVHACTHMCTQ